jgi:hypothetical protein
MRGGQPGQGYKIPIFIKYIYHKDNKLDFIIKHMHDKGGDPDFLKRLVAAD